MNKRGEEEEDLFQIGCIGLLKAIKKYTSSKEVKFSTYAFHLILGEIKMFLREDGNIKVSRSIKDNLRNITQLKEELLKKGKEDVKISEISSALNISNEDVLLALNSKNCMVSLDSSQNDSTSYHEKIDKRTNIENEFIEKELIKEVLKKLNKEERKIIVERYINGRRQKEIVEELNLSQVKVSRIEKSALNKLKAIIN